MSPPKTPGVRQPRIRASVFVGYVMRSITVYLDMCAIQRPLDSFEQVKVRLEAEAVLGILQYSVSRRVRLVSSEVLQ